MNTTEQTGPPVGPAPKRWPVALFVAFLTGILGAVIAVPVSDWAMEAHHVSAMEGGRACAAVGIFAPLAFLVGFAVGFFVSLRMAGAGFAGYLKRQVVSLLVISAIVVAVGGLGWASADHPPVIDGKNLALDIEVRVPTKGRSVEELQAADFSVALVVSASDRNYADMRWSDAAGTAEFITVPAWATLNSRNAGREIIAGVEGEKRQIFDVMLPSAPKKIDDAWSEWTPPRQRSDGSKPAPEDQYRVRYRVRFAMEYSPTPAPEPANTLVPEESPAPEPSATQ